MKIEMQQNETVTFLKLGMVFIVAIVVIALCYLFKDNVQSIEATKESKVNLKVVSK